MTHNLPDGKDEKIFRPAVDALQKVWKKLKDKDFDVNMLYRDENSAYYDLIDFCEAIVESEVPEVDDF